MWFQLLGLKLAVVWHVLQLADATGMCPLGLPAADWPSWQLAQLVAALKAAWSGLALAQVLVLWQVSQLVALAWIAVAGLPAAAMKLPVWQVAHWPDTLKAAWNLPEAQLLKLPLWQLSQLADAATDTDAKGMGLAGLPSAGGNDPEGQLARKFHE